MLVASNFRAIALMMRQQAETSETSVNFYETKRHKIPENIHLHTLRRENLKSKKSLTVVNLRVL
jgi:hypothetical protein